MLLFKARFIVYHDRAQLPANFRVVRTELGQRDAQSYGDDAGGEDADEAYEGALVRRSDEKTSETNQNVVSLCRAKWRRGLKEYLQEIHMPRNRPFRSPERVPPTGFEASESQEA